MRYITRGERFVPRISRGVRRQTAGGGPFFGRTSSSRRCATPLLGGPFFRAAADAFVALVYIVPSASRDALSILNEGVYRWDDSVGIIYCCYWAF